MFNKLAKGSIVALFAIALLLPQASNAENVEVPVKKITEIYGLESVVKWVGESV